MGIPYFLNDGVFDDTEIKIIKKKADKMQIELNDLKANDLSTHINNISSNSNNISSNNAAISTNSNNISSNNAAISTNSNNISINTGSISLHAGSINNIIQDISNLQSQNGTVLKLEIFNVTKFVAVPGTISTDSNGMITSTPAQYAYAINTIEQDDLNLTTGFTYRFDTSHSLNTGYTLKFALLPGGSQSSLYSDNVTFGADVNGNIISPGSIGSYTQITITESTPSTFYYYGETGLYFNQNSSGTHQKITHDSLRTSVDDFNIHIEKQKLTNGVYQQDIADISNSLANITAQNNGTQPFSGGINVTGTANFSSRVNLAGDIIQTSGVIKTNQVRAPTNTSLKTLLVKGGDANGSNVLLGTHDTYYRANRHFFYGRGGGTTPTNNSMPSSQTYGGIFFNGGCIFASDDRLKHNEEDIPDALSIIRKLNAQKYQKTTEPKEADFNETLTEDYIEETGFIAQEVMQIPELEYCVKDGITENGKDIHYLNYNDIFVVNVQAVKEMDLKVTLQQEIIDSLEHRLKKLEDSV
tara:strand:+ start:1023 stop:2606 length:1584 start_codon:yes stop_codon:yes gene_type:complete